MTIIVNMASLIFSDTTE